MTTVAIIGAGTMGHGIAHVAAVAGHDVMLFDVSELALQTALDRIGEALDSGVARGKLTAEQRVAAIGRVTTVVDIESAVANVDIVIEAAPEHLETKQSIFSRVSSLVRPDTLLATNTSSLSVTAIASAIEQRADVIGLHFFNPVAAMKLVEIVRGEFTSPGSVERARQFVASLGKKSIVVGDTPGFATSRLGVVLGLEAMRMLEQGVASAADIDTAMELGYNHPVGPLRLTDIVGLDVRLAVAERLHEALGGATYEPPSILREMVANGRLGRKSGGGFYDWP
ncbi:MAG: 3-hydroxyacyl-CoA dehydrogenase family protein [Gemmatimonadota bacterium]|nr:3-hydroxyacyl-CoA dehydrogenase family protein [Gemmatimonadota bacterium]